MLTSVSNCFVSEADLIHIATNMRQADIDELWASQKCSPEEGLRNSVALSDYSTSLIIKNEVVAILGLVKCEGLAADGVPWLLGTNAIDENPVAFVRSTKKVVEIMNEWCPRLMNYVHVDNAKSIKYLRALGFTVSEEPEPVGCDGGLFYKFEKGVEKCAIQ